MTPYSRRADGLAVLRSSIRAFVQRSHVSSRRSHYPILILDPYGDQVLRDVMYDGNPHMKRRRRLQGHHSSVLEISNYFPLKMISQH
jgi:hypothetical protein